MNRKDNLDDLRREIDKLDKNIVQLFEERMNLVEKVSEYKKENQIGILDSNREEELIAKNINYLKDKELELYLKEFYIHLMNISKAYQSRS